MLTGIKIMMYTYKQKGDRKIGLSTFMFIFSMFIFLPRTDTNDYPYR